MLKHGTPQDIQRMFQRLIKEGKNIIETVIELVYFMRGAIQYHDMMNMTPGERDMVSEFIKKRLEREKDRPHPTY
jgi:hypothetical protein